MTRRSFRPAVAGLALLGLLAASPAAIAEAPPAPAPVRLELNRLESVATGCRVYLVIGNEREEALRSLKLDLVLFGRDGVIDRRLAVETGPLHAEKTAVKLFDVADYPCPELGSVLVNDVLACEGEGGTIPACLGLLELATRAAVPLTR
jgi:hypothetical protein